MSEDTGLAEGLKKAAAYIASSVRRNSPSAHIAGSWRVTQHSDGSAHIVTGNVAAWATNGNARHPLFGDREHWYHTNQRSPFRTDWVQRAVDEAVDVAVDRLADEYIAHLGIEIL